MATHTYNLSKSQAETGGIHSKTLSDRVKRVGEIRT